MPTTKDDAGASDFEVRLFGGCEVRAGGRPLPPPRHRKDLWLLALLALRGGRDAPRDWLAATLWPDADESQALYNLRRSLSHLRQSLGAEAGRLLSPTPRTLRFDLAGAFADVAAFAEALRADPTEGQLERAVALYGGPLLADCQEEWVLPERNRYEQAYLGALEGLARRLLARGEPAAAVRPLRLLIAADPYRESAHAALMQALARSGDRAALGQVYHGLRALLRRDLNADPAPETRALYERLSTQGAQSVTLPDAAPAGRAAGRRLPVPLTDLIGRQAEIEEVVGWLGRARLVTLLGPGGVGKTRLAVGAAEAVLPRFEGGAWFVDLAPLADPGRVADTVARALGVTEETGQRLEERLAALIGGRPLLLVLDNCEHVAEACVPLAQTLLTSCPSLRVLATSRQPLGLTGEQGFRVPSLALPPERTMDEKDTTSLLDYAAVRLFVERARQAGPAFRLTPQAAAATADLCRRLDGIPLAIELAAARTRSLTVGEILARLDDRFRLLTGGSRSALPRQRTLRALVDWSYDLLTEPEKALLCRLSVFAGGWTLEAAETICADAEASGITGVRKAMNDAETLTTETVIEDLEVLDLLTSLVDKSLVVAETTGGRTRYRLLETIREYAAERLTAGVGGPEDAARVRHRDWFLTLIQAAAAGDAPPSSEQSDVLDAELDNLRAAMQWCLRPGNGDGADDKDEAEIGMQLARGLAEFLGLRGSVTEARTWLTRVLARFGDDHVSLARQRVLHSAGQMASRQLDLPAAETLATAALALSERLEDAFHVARAHALLGNIAIVRRDNDAAQAHFERALAVDVERGDPLWVAGDLLCLGNVAVACGDASRGRTLYEEAMAIARKKGNAGHVATVLVRLAWISLHENDMGQARAQATEALRLMQEWDSHFYSSMHAMALLYLGAAALLEGQLAEAWEHFLSGLSAARASDYRDEIGLWLLEWQSLLLGRLGRWERATRLLSAARRLRVGMGAPGFGVPAPFQAMYDAHISGGELKEALGETAFAAAWSAGQRMSWEEVIEYALDDVDAPLPPAIE